MLTKIESDYFHRRKEECELFWSLKGIVGQHLLKFIFCSWNFPELSLPYIMKDNRHRDYLLSTDSSEHLIPPVGGRRKGKEANSKIYLNAGVWIHVAFVYHGVASSHLKEIVFLFGICVRCELFRAARWRGYIETWHFWQMVAKICLWI